MHTLFHLQSKKLTISHLDWGDNPFELNEHFGTPDDLKSLSNALHARNMSLMVDVVINHLTSNEFAQNIDYSLFPAPFNTPTVFHPSCSIDYANQSSVEDCWLVESPPPVLADLDSENPAVYDPMVQSVVNIVKEYNVDGIRLDTARHIPKPYLAQFQKAVGVFVTGEAVNDSIPYVTQYQGPLNSALNYPLWYALIDAFLGRTTFDYLGSVLRIENIVFEDVNVLGNFLDNHDQPRFASRLGDDVVRDANAVAFLLFTSGIPIVYYGFEQRFDGGYDPVNRAPLWESGYNTEASLYQYIAALHKVRGLAAGIMGKSRYFATKTVVLGTSDTHMAFERGPLVVVVSNVGMDGVETPYMVSKSQFGSGVNLVDLLSCTTRKTSKDGSFLNPVHGGRPRVSNHAKTNPQMHHF